MLFLFDELDASQKKWISVISDDEEQKALNITYEFCKAILVSGKIQRAEKITNHKFSQIKDYVNLYSSCRALVESIYFFDAIDSHKTAKYVLNEKQKQRAIELLRAGVSLSKVSRALGFKPDVFRKMIDNDTILMKEIYNAIADYEYNVQSILLVAMQKAAQKGNVREISDIVFKLKDFEDNKKTNNENPYNHLFN
ncbi:MAG: hypothetical protein QW255_05560 [Candidatus Bilamarchaeaceae archaeon]